MRRSVLAIVAGIVSVVVILGALGTLVGLAGVAARWNMGLGPHWYPIAVAALGLPQSWLGGRVYTSL